MLTQINSSDVNQISYDNKTPKNNSKKNEGSSEILTESKEKKREIKEKKVIEEDKQNNVPNINLSPSPEIKEMPALTHSKNISNWAMNSMKIKRKREMKKAKKLRKQEKCDKLKTSLDASENIVNGSINQTQGLSDELKNLINKSDENSVVKSFTIQCKWDILIQYINNNLLGEETID